MTSQTLHLSFGPSLCRLALHQLSRWPHRRGGMRRRVHQLSLKRQQTRVLRRALPTIIESPDRMQSPVAASSPAGDPGLNAVAGTASCNFCQVWLIGHPAKRTVAPKSRCRWLKHDQVCRACHGDGKVQEQRGNPFFRHPSDTNSGPETPKATSKVA